jgi:hypothetical protein
VYNDRALLDDLRDLGHLGLGTGQPWSDLGELLLSVGKLQVRTVDLFVECSAFGLRVRDLLSKLRRLCLRITARRRGAGRAYGKGRDTRGTQNDSEEQGLAVVVHSLHMAALQRGVVGG